MEQTIEIYEAGLQLLRQGKFQEAITAFDYAIQLIPIEKLQNSLSGFLFDGPGLSQLTAMIINSRGTAKYDLRDYEGALTDYGYAIYLNPNSPDGYYNRARLHKDQENYRNALSDYDSAISLKENFREDAAAVLAYQNRAIVKSALGDIQGSLSDLEAMADLCKQQGNLDQYLTVKSFIHSQRLAME